MVEHTPTTHEGEEIMARYEWDGTLKFTDNRGALPGSGALGPHSATMKVLLSSDAKERKSFPIASGVLDYFTSALLEIAKVSYIGNQQHNPGEPLHWARSKSTDQSDTMLRHFMERGTLDSDGQRHSAKMAWRALAILQLELEAEGAPVARGAQEPEAK
jgi:hypothetical protein